LRCGRRMSMSKKIAAIAPQLSQLRGIKKAIR
jgi:hypothetical protein